MSSISLAIVVVVVVELQRGAPKQHCSGKASGKTRPFADVVVCFRVQFLGFGKADVTELEGLHQTLVQGKLIAPDLEFSWQRDLVDLV